MPMIVSGKEAGKEQKLAMDAGKYVRYTPEQVEALERVYNECPKPSSLRRQQLIRECPILSNIDPKQIKVWFQNRRFHFKSSTVFSGIGCGILCAKASMLLQNVPPALLVCFLKEHRSEWADFGVDAYSASSLRASPYVVPGVRSGSNFVGGQIILPLAHTTEHEEDGTKATRTLDLASTLEVGSGAAAQTANKTACSAFNSRSVLTVAFQFTYENHLRENVAAMARQYVRSVVTSVQRVAMAIAPSRLGSHIGAKQPLGSPEAHTLAQWIFRSYRLMFDIPLEKILDDSSRKVLYAEFPKIMQQGFAYLPAGICSSSMGRPISYEQVVAWKVLNDVDSPHCLAFMFVNWSFV
ncbi:hypothetical protein BHE74_00016061 [Ensete ventricosum]|nr:hypothetical protein BHE74_00016061 [Ensete ventricosum]